MGNLSIALNAANDIFVDADGNLAFVSGNAAVDQDCRCAMKAQQGEMQYNLTRGLPTLTDVFQNRLFIKWEAIGRATLAGINGVVRVVSFTVTTSGDALSYVAVIQTVYSPTLLTISNTLGAT